MEAKRELISKITQGLSTLELFDELMKGGLLDRGAFVLIFTIDGGADPVVKVDGDTSTKQPNGPPSNFMFRKIKEPPWGFMETIVQSLKWRKSKSLPSNARLAKSWKGIRTTAR
jgi:hypothetical protein